ncbi:MAG: TetR/AcrR family transcriptional regulator [Actinomycetota bacterium]|nr:TetR/AcrR family transcriptional regulator [Actinomycetota bacterium]
MPRTAASTTLAGQRGTTRARNPQGQEDRLRHDLLDAAAELLAEHGSIEGVSLRAIATRAGVSPTAVYRHFDDHTALIAASIRHCWSEFTSAINIDPAEEPDPFARFRLMGDLCTNHPDLPFPPTETLLAHLPFDLGLAPN